MKNYGLNYEKELAEQSPEDYVFGVSSQSCIAHIPEEHRITYLPVGEVQKGIEDFSDCATRGPVNLAETKFAWLYQNNKTKHSTWLEEKGYIENGKPTFSDIFTAILSGTDRDGNSLKAPLQAIHEFGLIPKSMLPARKDMTWNDYHNPANITQEMKDLGQEFLKRFSIKYDRVYEENFSTLLKEDLLDVAGYAWEQPINGEYPRSTNQPNHCFIIYRNPMSYAFDNYFDLVDGDFIKKLASDYDFINYGYRLYISELNAPEAQKVTPRQCFLRKLLLRFLFGSNLGAMTPAQQEMYYLTNRVIKIENELKKLNLDKMRADIEGVDALQEDHQKWLELVDEAIKKFRARLDKVEKGVPPRKSLLSLLFPWK